MLGATRQKQNIGAGPDSGNGLKIAICGIRGIPACYGGFETFAEELASRLVKRGHEVTVYGRKNHIHFDSKTYKGINLCVLPAPRHKYLETPVHTVFCLLHLLSQKPDAILVCNAANSPFLWIPRIFGQHVAVNVDGVERLRSKWNCFGRWWYRLGEITSVLFADAVVSDAEVIRKYYLKRYGSDSVVIRYGFKDADPLVLQQKLRSTDGLPALAKHPLFESLGISPGEYILYVSRLEPENNAHLVIQAYNSLPEELRQKKTLVIVGDAPYAKDYIAGLKRDAGPNVIFTGYRFGEDYGLLQLGAYFYIQATEVGGTHPALVEALGFGNCVLANSTPENIEVLENAGVFYKKNSMLSLRREMEVLLTNPKVVLDFRQMAIEHARSNYNWDEITSVYERLFYWLASPRKLFTLRKQAEASEEITRYGGEESALSAKQNASNE